MKSKKILFFILVLTCSVSIQAADFSAGSIYYNITGENTVEVTSLSPGSYTGDIEIPSSVDYEETTYQVTAIGNSTFQFCVSLMSVVIPSTVESIGDGAFFACVGLPSITLPEGLKHIGNETFSSCIKFTSLTIPQSVLSIGNSAFASCTGLTEIFVSWDNPETVTYGNTIFNGVNTTSCKIKIGINQVELYKEIPTWNIFENFMEYNPDFIVNDYGELIQYVGSGGDIVIPYGVKDIRKEVFKDNTTITSVVIPNSVESIREGAFSGCTALTSITIPQSVNYIENFVFVYCAGLQEINVSWTDPRAIADGGSILYGTALFFFTPATCIVNVPEGTLNIYNTYPWFHFDNIRYQAVPTIQELEEQGLVQEVSELEYAASGAYGDEKSFKTYLQLSLWYCTYVCKYNLNEGDILYITDNDEEFNPAIKIYDEQENEQTTERVSENTKIVGFKAETAGVYYIQFSGMSDFENAAYDFSIHKYGELQSIAWGEIPAMTEEMSDTDIKSLLFDLSITGLDLYGQNITLYGLSDFWTIDRTNGTAAFEPSHDVFENIKFSLASDIDNTIQLWSKIHTNTIGQINSSEIKIYTQNRTVIVENATEPVFIYNMLGSRIAMGENGKFEMPNKGIYVVKTGKTVKKIIIKD